MENIGALIDAWITTRNALIKRHNMQDASQKDFFDAINSAARGLRSTLDVDMTVNDARIEALHELTGSLLTQLRMERAAFERN